MSRSRAPDDQAKLKKQLNELTKLEENKFCADCGCRGPRWASINLGVFICIACSGIHRSLGVHLTFVRSVNLDSWTADQVQQMQRWGNARAKAYYEANVPRDYRVPTEHSSVREKELWIREKYERKRFVGAEPKENKIQESEDEPKPRKKKESRQSSRTSSREAVPVAPQPEMLSFDVFSAPVPKTEQLVPVAPVPAKQDDWASFGGSSNAQSGFQDAFAPAPVDQHSNKMANIMASFGTQQPQQNAFPSQPQQNAFPTQQNAFPGQMPPAPMMGMNMNVGMMNGMGMMPPRPMMAPGQGFMNPMMQPNMMAQQPNMMMNPMQNQMFGAQTGMMMNGGFQGGAVPMGMNPMGMNPMGMNPMGMNQGGFQQQQQQQQRPPQQQQQQPQAGGLNQPFVTFG